MKDLLISPGVAQLNPFHFWDDAQRPAQCELLVNPAQGWAIATEQADAGGRVSALARSTVGLANKICQHFDIEPGALSLFVRYYFPELELQEKAYESVYVVHFAHGSRDLFDGVRFAGVSRELLGGNQLTYLRQALSQERPLLPHWRALTPRR